MFSQNQIIFILSFIVLFLGACKQKQILILNIDPEKRSDDNTFIKEKNIINEKYQFPIGAPKIVSFANDLGLWTPKAALLIPKISKNYKDSHSNFNMSFINSHRKSFQ